MTRLGDALEFIFEHPDSSKFAQGLAKLRDLLRSTPSILDQPTYEYIGKVTGYDEDSERVLVEWDGNSKFTAQDGTLLFVRLWTQAEIDECYKRADELISYLKNNSE